MITELSIKNLEEIRRQGLEALNEKLGPAGMIKFIQLYTNGEGDYTKEREENLKDFDKEDFEKFVKERRKKNNV